MANKEFSAYIPDEPIDPRYITTHTLRCKGCGSEHSTDAFVADGVASISLGDEVTSRCEHCLSEVAVVTNEEWLNSEPFVFADEAPAECPECGSTYIDQRVGDYCQMCRTHFTR